MKATDISIKSLEAYGDAEKQEDEYKELVDLDVGKGVDTVKLTFLDGTKLILTTSAWAIVYIKEPS